MTDEFIVCHLNIEYWFFLLLLSSFEGDKDLFFLGYEVIHCHHQYPIRFTIIIRCYSCIIICVEIQSILRVCVITNCSDQPGIAHFMILIF